MKDTDPIVIRNVMEDVVESKLPSLIASSGCCSCERCRADIITYALNNLPPRYVASDSGNVFTQYNMLETQNQVDIMSVMIRAIEIIKRNPRHIPAQAPNPTG